MNSLIKNKKKALKKVKKFNHEMSRFYMVLGFALSRCKVCGMMLYVGGKPNRYLYRKIISGDATHISCEVGRLAKNE